MGPGELLAILAGIASGTLICMTPIFIVRNVLAHRERIAKIQQGVDSGRTTLTPADVDALRREMAALRETTTRFDMSFDAALARVEERLDSLETGREGQETLPIERREYGTHVTEDAPVVSLGRR